MDKELRNKIVELFDYRELPHLINYRQSARNNDLYEKLIRLQYEIYKLDHVLESSWDVDQLEIARRWKKIYDALYDLGIPTKDHNMYCGHIYKYQKHELEIRQRKLPTRLSMEYFYFYKSCDVKLLRKIIYNNNPNLRKDMKLSHWRLFDLVTEINDDVEDVFEDLSTINGNRFLISFVQKGEKKTKEKFNSFLDELHERNRTMDYELARININSWTEKQIKLTKELMLHQLEALRDSNTSKYDFVCQESFRTA